MTGVRPGVIVGAPNRRSVGPRAGPPDPRPDGPNLGAPDPRPAGSKAGVRRVEMPTGLVVQPLIVGDGPAVVEGQSITVQYSGWLWDGTLFDSSWEAGYSASFVLAQESLIDGWVQGLAGQPVGSQVLLILPPELAYGDVAQGTIPAGSTLVFVVDILAAS